LNQDTEQTEIAEDMLDCRKIKGKMLKKEEYINKSKRSNSSHLNVHCSNSNENENENTLNCG
jgi:hypothetical protein